jgi:ketosteroid isomerase-like protein
MSNVYSSEEIREVAMAFDQALESKDERAVMDMFADDCEIELLSVKLLGKEGAKKWINWIYTHTLPR